MAEHEKLQNGLAATKLVANVAAVGIPVVGPAVGFAVEGVCNSIEGGVDAYDAQGCVAALNEIRKSQDWVKLAQSNPQAYHKLELVLECALRKKNRQGKYGIAAVTTGGLSDHVIKGGRAFWKSFGDRSPRDIKSNKEVYQIKTINRKEAAAILFEYMNEEGKNGVLTMACVVARQIIKALAKNDFKKTMESYIGGLLKS